MINPSNPAKIPLSHKKNMNASQLRQTFIDFFKDKTHTFVPSESLLPSSPNLLFTNAGMNQFVPYFLAERVSPNPRIVNSQKCIRAGGKHNDLEDVGFDTYHHTFFEMLGNWSIGDYFKKDAIHWAWELLTKVWKLPKNRLYVTVYKPGEGDPASFDQEAYDFWSELLKQEGLDPKKHIVYGNKKDNFWMMGDTGPCGPCSEIHMDLTPNGDTNGKLVNADSSRCIELWNLVFIQFNAQPDGSFVPLPAKHVDTGMGLERVAGIIATTRNFTDFTQEPSNYNSDLFTPIFKKLTELSGSEYKATVPTSRDKMSQQEGIDCAFRVIADHIRTLTFSIADGIIPGNEGRNYVIRRILRRAVLFGKKLNLPHGFLSQLIDPVVQIMSDHFPEVIKNEEMVRKVISNEEQTFERTLDRGLQLLDKITETSKTISGLDAFTLYDTYGFPIDLTQLIARERGLTIDMEGFTKAMEAQRERARAAQKKSVITVSDSEKHSASTPFVGFEPQNLTQFKTKILDIIQDADKNFIILDSTPFYAEMGGQIGDTGVIKSEKGEAQVLNTIKNESGQILHQVDKTSALTPGSTVEVSINTHRRAEIQRHHSATHLLHWALRNALGTHVHQAGSLVTDERLRFDFSHYEALTPEVIKSIENQVNAAILRNAPVIWTEVPFDQKPEDCIAFFGEKYGSVVRVVDIGGFSKELCGGTHVQSTGEIGLFKIATESAIAAGTRRIEAVVGSSAMTYINERLHQLSGAAALLSCGENEVQHRLDSLSKENTELRKSLRVFEQKQAASQANDLQASAIEKEGIKWVAGKVVAPSPNELRSMAVQIANNLGTPSVVVLGAAFGEKTSVLALCSPEAIQKGHKAGDIVKEITAKLDGKGGGKPDLAMGGGGHPEKLENVLNALL